MLYMVSLSLCVGACVFVYVCAPVCVRNVDMDGLTSEHVNPHAEA